MIHVHICDDCESDPCLCDEYGAEEDDVPIECEMCFEDVDVCECYEECEECESLVCECVCFVHTEDLL